MPTSKDNQTRILVVDDHPIVRRGIVETLAEAFAGVEIGEAASSHECLEKVWHEKWSIILLDISMPGRSGLDILRTIKAAQPKLPVLILSMHSEEQFAVRVLQSGAAGYLTKGMAGTELIAAMQKVLAGGRYICASVAESLASHLDRDSSKPLHHTLSNREFEVLCLIASGKTVKEIGVQLSLSIKTISTYRTRILEKMALRNNAELMRYAVENDLVQIKNVHANADG